EDQQLVALWRMEADVNDGGFMQFLCNWGDPTCQLALRALQAMGAVQTHAILAGMRGLLDRLEDDPAITQLHDLYGAMTEQEQDALHAFDEAYFERPEDLARLGLKNFGPEPLIT
ncbi:MAG: DMP19 family protein, partial [Pseudomonadales bacterium]